MREDGKIDYLELPAGDVGAIKEFYGAAFGFSQGIAVVLCLLALYFICRPAPKEKEISEAAAAKAIANAKTRSPSSLSDVPGGVAASTNPAEGLADASAQDLISKFEGLSEKARWELIEKIS